MAQQSRRELGRAVAAALAEVYPPLLTSWELAELFACSHQAIDQITVEALGKVAERIRFEPGRLLEGITQ